MAKATVSGTIIAESADTIVIEGSHYFPPGSVSWDHFNETELTTGCPWKGQASYYNVSVDGQQLDNVAWAYHEPKDAAAEIKDYVAFYPAVTVEA